MTITSLSDKSGFSIPQFYRVFYKFVGVPVKNYITKRKLQFAIHEISMGRRIIDVAMDFGFETHTGFDKAFKKQFGLPPLIYRLHNEISYPQKIDLNKLKLMKTGGIILEPKIITINETKIAGFECRNKISNIKHTSDTPAFWNESEFNDGEYEKKLYDAFPNAKHGEYCLSKCSNETDEFVYILGINVDNYDNIKPEMTKLTLPSTMYAVFTTPEVKPDDFPTSIKGTWQFILDEWLPNSEYAFDDTKYDFEFYDERCHDWEYEKICMDIYIPIKTKYHSV